MAESKRLERGQEEIRPGPAATPEVQPKPMRAAIGGLGPAVLQRKLKRRKAEGSEGVGMEAAGPDRGPVQCAPAPGSGPGEAQAQTRAELASPGRGTDDGPWDFEAPWRAFAPEQPVQRMAAGDGSAESEPQIQHIAASGVSGSGTTLPHMEAIQRSFGPEHDLSQVRAHIGGPAAAAAQQIGAAAYATGNHVAFAGPPDLWLAAHETAHVMQQRAGVQLAGGVGQVGDEYEQNADAVAERVVQGRSAADLLPRSGRSAGQATIQQSSASSTPGRCVQMGVGDARVSYARAEVREYQSAIKELEQFRQKKYQAISMGSGFDVPFLADYDPDTGELRITVQCTFAFHPGEVVWIDNSTMPYTARYKPRTWTPEEEVEWKNKFFQVVNSTWSGKHTFYCQRDWWEHQIATVAVHFVEAKGEPQPGSREPYKINVYGGSKNGLERSGVKGLTVELDEGDIQPLGPQTAAAHEAGHMLHLGDEYAEDARGTTEGMEVRHSPMVEAEFGHPVFYKKNDTVSIMAAGGTVLPEHGVYFLAALRDATGMSAWGVKM